MDEWKKNSVSLEDAALKALRFVQDEVRYLAIVGGIKAFKPADPLKTFKSRFGDCKAKSNLLRSFLDLLGIPSFPCLVSGKLSSTIANYLPDNVFNHVILRIDLLEKSIFVDPTMSYQGGDLFHTSLPDYGFGLKLSEESQDLTPIQSPQVDYDREFHTTFKVESIDQVDAQFIVHWCGDKADLMRYFIKKDGQKEISESRLNFAKKNFGKIDPLTTNQIEDDRELNRITQTQSYRLQKPWREDKTMQYSLPLLSSNLRQHIDTKRKTPLAMDWPKGIKETVTVTGASLKTSAKTIECKAFTLICKAETEGKIECEFTSLLNTLNPEDLEEVSKKLDEALESIKFTISQRE